MMKASAGFYAMRGGLGVLEKLLHTRLLNGQQPSLSDAETLWNVNIRHLTRRVKGWQQALDATPARIGARRYGGAS